MKAESKTPTFHTLTCMYWKEIKFQSNETTRLKERGSEKEMKKKSFKYIKETNK